MAECGICLSDAPLFGKCDSCIHEFCLTCLLKWSKEKYTCPMCRAVFFNIEFHNRLHPILSVVKIEKYVKQETSFFIDMLLDCCVAYNTSYFINICKNYNEDPFVENVEFPSYKGIFPEDLQIEHLLKTDINIKKTRKNLINLFVKYFLKKKLSKQVMVFEILYIIGEAIKSLRHPM